MKLACLYILTVFFASCATVFNSQHQKITVYTSKPAKISVNNTGIDSLETAHTTVVKRSKEPLQININTPTENRDITIAPHESFIYYANILFLPFVFIDELQKAKKYGFPRSISVDLEHNNEPFLIGMPGDEEKMNLIKFTPLKMISFFNPSAELSYERINNKRFTTQASASVLLPYSMAEFMSIGRSEKYQGFRFGLEQRYFLRKQAPNGAYLAVETEYLRNKYRTIENFAPKTEPKITEEHSYSYPDSIRVHKQFWGFHFKLGKQFIKRQFYIDIYAGAGLRVKKMAFFDRINPSDLMINKNHHDITSNFRKEGTVYAPSIPLNFRIGYRF